MMDVEEIRGEIGRLSTGETTYRACERLAILSMAESALSRRITPPQPETGYSFSPGNGITDSDSEFVSVARQRPIDKVLSVLDQHMDAIKALYPKEYDAVIRRITEIGNA